MDEKKLTIYFTSDLHGYIYPTDYRGSEEKELGLFKCASLFRKDGNTLVIAFLFFSLPSIASSPGSSCSSCSSCGVVEVSFYAQFPPSSPHDTAVPTHR